MKNNTIYDSNGKILFYSIDDFIANIGQGTCCFICGAKPESKLFNDEHVIPDWILRKFNLNKKFINLPNGTKLKYNQYTVPCCEVCNSELGKIYEKEISKLINQSYEKFIHTISQDKSLFLKLFKWLCLIFIKTHIKDKSLLYERDLRKNSGYIADDYDWYEMHHIHCIARSHHTNAQITDSSIGSMFFFPTQIPKGFDSFDYIDGYKSKVLLLQLGDIAIISVLNDSGGCATLLREDLKKITAPLSAFQLREIVAHLSYINLNLKYRPTFKSLINKEKEEYYIVADIPKVACLNDEEQRIESYGKFLRFFIEPLIGDVENRDLILKDFEEGKRSYLFDQNGEFIEFGK